MSRFHTREPQKDSPPLRLVGDHADKLHNTPAMHVDYDEAPTREDRSSGHTPFEIPVKLPGFMRPRSERTKKSK
jgi:hypothetical protein